jgi:hypothetical protein
MKERLHLCRVLRFDRCHPGIGELLLFLIHRLRRDRVRSRKGERENADKRSPEQNDSEKTDLHESFSCPLHRHRAGPLYAASFIANLLNPAAVPAARFVIVNALRIWLRANGSRAPVPFSVAFTFGCDYSKSKAPSSK